MLRELINSISGATATTTFSNPIGYGINNVPPQATFSNFLKTLASSLTNNSQATFGAGFPVGQSGINPASIQAYRNAQSGFIKDQRVHNKAQAFAPGAVVVNSLNGGGQQILAPQAITGGIAPNQLSALSPLSGSTYQNSPSSFPQGQLPFPQGQLPFTGGGYNQGGIGKLQLLLLPLIGVFSLVKSLFGIRRFLGTIQPVKVNREDLRFYDYQASYNDYAREEGSFDEYNPELETENFDTEKLGAY